MEAIPLVRTRYAIAFSTALRAQGVSIEPLLQRAHLPLGLIEHPDGLIGADALWAYAGDAARRTGLRDLGLLAGATPVAEHGEFGTQVVYAPTLHCAICTFCAEASAEYSEADFYLKRQGGTAWFCRGPIEGAPDQLQQVELYVMALMVQTICMAMGPDWQPARLQMQNEDSRGLRDAELVRNADTEFGAPATRIALPVAALSLPLQHSPCPVALRTTSFVFNAERASPPEDFLESLNLVVASHLGHHPLPIQVAAEITGLSVRTLQRRLRRRGLSYSQLFEQTRYRAATRLLKDPDVRITDVAYELGYSEVAHFTRAFKRMAGINPSEYRLLRMR